MQISGSSALVTGGASGLGRATVEALVEAGASATIIDIPGSEGAEVADALGKQARFVPTDVTSKEEVASAVEAAVESFGDIHIVVNCAGVGDAGRVVSSDGEAFQLERFERVVRVNLIGTFNVVRLAAARIVAQEPVGEERGVIVNTASIAAFDGQIGQSAYSASKGGVVGMTLPLARDLAARLVRVVTIAPGTFDTPMLGGLPDAMRQRLAEGIPHPRRLGKPEEFAALVCHIVSNPMINGEVIRLDGGLRMPPK